MNNSLIKAIVLLCLSGCSIVNKTFQNHEYKNLKVAIENSDRVFCLNLSNQNLNSIDSSILCLKHLKKLNLSNNNFTAFPQIIVNLKTLEFLDLNDNKIANIPKELSYLCNLKLLWLENNYLSTLPIEIGELKNLSYINIRNNKFSLSEIELIKCSVNKGCEVISHSIIREPPPYNCK